MSETNMLCELPKLEYGYKDLAPYLSEKQVRVHHGKHHQRYVNGANEILRDLGKTRKANVVDMDLPSKLKDLSFNLGNHLLHSLFWSNLAPAGKGGANPGGRLSGFLAKEFGSVDRFKREFAQAALDEGDSGWVALTYSQQSERPVIMKIGKENTQGFPLFTFLLVADVFEHAYEVDYKNDRAKFVDALFHIVNWDAVDKRLEKLIA